MKIDAKEPPEKEKPLGLQSFRKLLKEAEHPRGRPALHLGKPEQSLPGAIKPPALPGAKSLSSAGLLRAQAQVRGTQVAVRARQSGGEELNRLSALRGETQACSQEQVHSRSDTLRHASQQTKERALESISQELTARLTDEQSTKGSAEVSTGIPPEPASLTPRSIDLGATVSAETKADLQAKAAQAIALIEQIEIFVKHTHRPTLAITLNNSLGARVEIERVAPGEVAVKLVGQHGPPTPEAVGRIREEMHARRLKIAVLSVA